MSDATPPARRVCEWCDSPMDVDGRAVCPTCGRLSSRLAAMEPPTAPSTPDEPVRPPATPPATAPAARPRAGEPQQLGAGRLAPAPLPETDERAWWKIAVPVAAVVLVVLVGVWFVALRPGDDQPAPIATPTTASKSRSTVDIGDVDDPTTTGASTSSTTSTTEVPSTTTTPGSERVEVSSGGGLRWSMQAPPVRSEQAASKASWAATVGDTTEVVQITELGGAALDVDAALTRFVEPFSGTLAGLRDSHLSESPGRTASFTGTLDGRPVVGWLVGAQIGAQAVVVATYRTDGDLDALYPEFLALPGSVSVE